MPDKYPIIYKSPRQTVLENVRKGLSFQALEAKKIIDIDMDCRKADCGVCIIKVVKGSDNLSKPEAGERDFLKAMNASVNERLACQCRIFGPVEVENEF